MLEELKENGINLSRLSEEVGLSRSGLAIAKLRGVTFGDVESLVKSLKKKSKILNKFNPKKDSIIEVCRSASVKQSFLAKQIGISKQGLNQYLSPERQVQLRTEVRRVASNIDSLASQLEKIKL
jgi:DNA-binding phage protein